MEGINEISVQNWGYPFTHLNIVRPLGVPASSSWFVHHSWSFWEPRKWQKWILRTKLRVPSQWEVPTHLNIVNPPFDCFRARKNLWKIKASFKNGYILLGVRINQTARLTTFKFVSGYLWAGNHWASYDLQTETGILLRLPHRKLWNLNSAGTLKRKSAVEQWIVNAITISRSIQVFDDIWMKMNGKNIVQNIEDDENCIWLTVKIFSNDSISISHLRYTNNAV